MTFFDFDFFDFFFTGRGGGSLTRRGGGSLTRRGGEGGPLRVGEGGPLRVGEGGPLRVGEGVPYVRAATYVRVLLLAERACASAGECRWDPGAVVSGAAISRNYNKRFLSYFGGIVAVPGKRSVLGLF